jgi:RNA polymerase sigma factor (sigma-70 family)
VTDLTEEIVTAAVAGDSDALGTIYAVLSPKVHGYLRARGADDPEGLTHEVFVHVLRRMGGIVGGAAGLRTFVFSVAHARYVDEVRRHDRRPKHAAYRAELDDRSEPSAESTVLNGQRLGHLSTALGRLQDDQRSVITLRVLGDLSIEQTAEVLGRSPGAIKQLQRRGLLALRALVDRGEVAL